MKDKIKLWLSVLALLFALVLFDKLIPRFPPDKASEAFHHYLATDRDELEAAIRDCYSFDELIALYGVDDDELLSHVSRWRIDEICHEYTLDHLDEYLLDTYTLSDVQAIYQDAQSSSNAGATLEERLKQKYK